MTTQLNSKIVWCNVGGGSEQIGIFNEGTPAYQLSSSYINASARCTAVHSGHITSIWAYSLCGTATGNLKVGVYEDSAGNPGARISPAVAPAFSVGTWTEDWKEFTGWGPTDIPIVADHSYWICFELDGAGSNVVYFYRIVDAAGSRRGMTATYGENWPTPYSQVNDSTSLYSFKATVTY